MANHTVRTIMSLAIPFGILAVAVALWFHFWSQRRAERAAAERSDLSPEDRAYYDRQGQRRLTGIILMAVIALALIIDSLFFLPPFNRRHRLQFAWFWTITVVLVLWMFLLAVADLVAIWGYARRHRRAIQAERHRLIDDYRRARARSVQGRQADRAPDSAGDQAEPDGRAPGPS